MKFLPLFLCLFLSYAVAQPAPTNPQQVTAIVANAASTGTTLNKLAKLTSSGAVITATTDTSAYGVVVGGAGTTGNAQIIISGNAGCAFDGATTQGNWVIPSTTVAGDCHDSGSASTVAPPVGTVAIVQSTNGAAGTYLVTQRVVSAALSAGVSSVTIAGAGGLTTSGTCTITSTGTCTLYTPGGFLNKFRNPGFDIAQRGTSGSVSAGTTAYTLDGWQISATGAAAAWARQTNSGVAGNDLVINCATGLTALTVQQRIESYLAWQLRAGTNSATVPITIQFGIINNSGATITPQLATQYPNATDNFSAVTTDLAATNLQSIPNNSYATVAYTFTPANNIDAGYQIQLLFGGACNAASGSISIFWADVRATPGVTAGLNSNPPQPEIPPVAEELALCQRYYYQYTAGTSNDQIANVWIQSSTSARAEWQLPVTMRAPPAITATASQLRVVTAAATGTGTAVSPFGNLQLVDLAITVSGFTAGQAGLCQLSAIGNFIAASAEL